MSSAVGSGCHAGPACRASLRYWTALDGGAQRHLPPDRRGGRWADGKVRTQSESQGMSRTVSIRSRGGVRRAWQPFKQEPAKRIGFIRLRTQGPGPGTPLVCLLLGGIDSQGFHLSGDALEDEAGVGANGEELEAT